ncbi:nitrite reductase small subunit NirD [uncultured Vibrio sp.]|uniref:nitrite reductase small subunit NirD n=1 Tax=uncultured Vibrio sp. TaxID=114054 RepID=UPI000910994F|nr:nitrite reductase small subunit NirD [uncultured Vibrio sp.]OIQ25568.1 MAG: nitrite reductase small subunit [Vibrio sp. MedPE-SWchi]
MKNWITVCSSDDLIPNMGVCAKVEEQQVAIFYCGRSSKLYALSNLDPFSGVNVISRGIIGSLDDQPCVASPLYKQHFHLETGVCMEEPEVQLATYPVRLSDNEIQVQLPEPIAA